MTRFLLTLALATVCAVPGAHAQEKIKIGYWSSGFSVGFGAVLEAGKFVEQQGLVPEYVRFADVTGPTKAILTQSIDATFGSSPVRSQVRKPPKLSNVTASQRSPNASRYCHHNASARAYDFTVFGEARCTRRYSRYSSAGSTIRWSAPNTVHVRSPAGSVSRCDRTEQASTGCGRHAPYHRNQDNESAKDTRPLETFTHPGYRRAGDHPR